MTNHAETARLVLTANESVLFGIFGTISRSGYFPPREFLNEFLNGGSDPCDQDGRMAPWRPFVLSPDEYDEVAAWWLASYPGTVVTHLGVSSWSDWTQVILNPEDWGYPDGLPFPGDPTLRARPSE